jgi:phosphoenolpyruvate synthase/pyruvate phosphate dikinase
VATVAVGSGGTRQVRVDGPKRKRPCLSSHSLTQLVKLALECERLSGWPQDIEWAIASNQLWILQARPITCRPHHDGAG